MPSRTPAVPESVRLAAQTCLDLKAEHVVILDLHGVSDMTDYFVIASGTSDTHVRALGERVQDALRAAGERPTHVEGLPQGRWVLLDYVDFVVHLFHPALRQFYQLERLWGDAEVVPLRAQQGAGA
ncbi:MAG: ribosome silencing factor [Gemmatimonadota bacterium]|nr:ribosome silencing factor [Gemmatimonadota bacterium]MDE3171810.1 ribosome silencing factor [Gemmatimonadota bacterium]MDE3215893.1 ribosome silencing factor [Gemmatimonadota bacterium]